ncbi:hypothetical protein Trydic_g3263 [Trypoxylus dichotomus]
MIGNKCFGVMTQSLRILSKIDDFMSEELKPKKIIPDCIVPTAKEGRSSVLVWRCFPFAGTEDLCRVQGNEGELFCNTPESCSAIRANNTP